VCRVGSILGLTAFLLSGCAEVPEDEPASYIVQRQDTLYSIAWRNNVDFKELAAWNGIGSDFRITPGQTLVLRPGNAAPTPSTGATPPRRARAGIGAPPPLQPQPQPPFKWVWPTNAIGAPERAPRGGVLLTGRPGQEVRTAAGGRVVYIGNGIRGFGNLIIIKHSETMLAAYAYNHDVLVHEGQQVNAAQPIATMGLGPKQTPVLYFEIRVNGKPVDTIAWLLKK
jgi:lipoprotein NlpD